MLAIDMTTTFAAEGLEVQLRAFSGKISKLILLKGLTVSLVCLEACPFFPPF